MPSEYTIHIVAPAQYAQIKPAIEQINEINGEMVRLTVTGWDYSFSTLAHWAGTPKNKVPDIVLMFDVAEYPRLDEKTGGILHYAGMINCIREARLKVDSKYVFILSSDKEENLEFINELMKINIHNFHFAPKEFTVDDLKRWMFTPERSLKDNEKYLLAGEGLARMKVIIETIEQERNEKSKIKEKIVTVEKIIKEPVSFKKLVLSIWGNGEFACELAYMAARLTKYKVLLANLVFISSNAGAYMGLTDRLNELARDPPESFGFTAVFDALGKGRLSFDVFEKACIKKKGLDNLCILMDPGGVENFEKYKSKDISGFIGHAYRYFDIIVLILDKSIFDPVTITALSKSDWNIIAAHANVDSLMEYGTYLKYMKERHQISPEKVKYVAFEYKKGINLPVSCLKSVFTGDSFLGVVNYSREREVYRNLNSFYVKWAFRKNPAEYVDILSKFNIIPGRTFRDRIRDWIVTKTRKAVKILHWRNLLQNKKQKNGGHESE